MSKHHNIDLVEFRATSPKQKQQLTTFYSSVFDWQYKDWGPEYSDTHDSGVVNGIDVVAKERMSRTLTVVYSKDLEATKKAVVESGGVIIEDTYSFPGGKRFHFEDPAGNELAVWSE